MGFGRDAEGRLHHHDHDGKERGEPDRHECKPDVTAEQTEERRHEGGAHIGARHLDADDRAGVFRSEVEGRGMNDGGIDRRTAETYDDEGGKRERGYVEGKEEHDDARGGDAGTEDDHLSISQFPRDEAAYKSSRRHADIEQRGELRRLCFADAFDFHKVGARPAHGGGLCRAVAQKADEKEGYASDLQGTDKADGLLLRRLQRFMPRLLPDGDRCEQDNGDDRLQDPDDEISSVPGGVGEGVAHHEGGNDGPHSPEAVQPAHVTGGIMESDVIVEGSVDRARAEAVGNGKDEEHPEFRAEGKTDEGDGCQEDADDGHARCAEFMDQAVGKEAGDNGTARDDHCYDPHIGDGHIEFHMNDGPARTQEGVGKPEADKCEIDEGKK